MELTELTIKQAHEGLKEKKFSSVDLTKAYLKKIKETDKELNAFLSVAEDSALAQAEEADKKTDDKDEPVEGEVVDDKK